jgi:hypothetical protein
VKLYVNKPDYKFIEVSKGMVSSEPDFGVSRMNGHLHKINFGLKTDWMHMESMQNSCLKAIRSNA